MIECKPSDYLTVSCLPGETGCSIEQLLFAGLDALLLDGLYDKFEPVAQNFMYENILRYGDISIKIPYERNYVKQGVCFEFSGQGLDYYLEYLTLHRNRATLRFVLRRFIGLAQRGFKTQCSRFDVAFDEKIRKGEQVKACLDLDIIQDTLKKGLFVTHFRKGEPKRESGELKSVFTVNPEEIDECVPYQFIESMNLSSGRIGKTIQLGRRKSRTFVRFYDKLAEQEAHGYELPADVIHWVRFETEYKGKNATSVMCAYAQFENDSDFADYMRNVSMNNIRFIDNDKTRKYNCTVAAWWFEFLDKAKGAKLVHNKPKHNRYVRALEAKKSKQSASFAAVVSCNRENLKSILMEGFLHPTNTAKAIVADYDAIKNLPPDEYGRIYQESVEPEKGLDFWKRHSCMSYASDEEFEKFMEKCVEDLCTDVLEQIKPLNDDNK